MKRLTVVVPWPEGLHVRPSARLVQTAQRFRSSLFLLRGDERVDMRSILSILAMCAWSRTIKYEGEWVSFEQYLKRRFNIDTSHSISPATEQKVLREMKQDKDELENFSTADNGHQADTHGDRVG